MGGPLLSDGVNRNAHSSHKNLVTVVDAEVGVRKEDLTGILPSQSDDFVVEYVERKAFPQISVKVQPKEVMPPLKKIPGVVQLDAPQLGKFVPLVLGTEDIIHGRCCDSRRANCDNNELVVLVGDGTEDGSAESSHQVSSETKGIPRGVTEFWQAWFVSVWM